MKYLNYILLLTLLVSAFFLKEHLHVSTNLASLFAPKEKLQELNIANKLGYSNDILIAVKGFGYSAQTEVRELSQKLQKLKQVTSIQSSLEPSKELQKYFKTYYPLLSNFKQTEQTQQSIHQTLQELYDTQFSTIFYTPINANDPLGLFKLPEMQKLKQGSYGYILRVKTTVSTSQMAADRQLYKAVKNILKPYPNVISFAPFYYTVENSRAIKKDVQFIIILSTLVLLFIYFILLKNIKLLLHTLITLGSSMLFATLISTFLFKDFNILSLAFGMSITAVSIDYLLHYYFHHFYSASKRVEKNVLYGFLTTATAFGLFSFIDIPLIAQISFFTLLSLSFAYIVFTFVFPYLNIPAYQEHKYQTLTTQKISAYFIFLLSIMLFIYTAFTLQLDTNIRHLDYQNLSLQKVEEKFKDANRNKLYPKIVQANSLESLVMQLHTLHTAPYLLSQEECKKRKNILENYDFSTLKQTLNFEAKNIGYKPTYFQKAYDFAMELPECKAVTVDDFKRFGLSVYKEKNVYYTLALIDNPNKALSITSILKNTTKDMYKELMQFSFYVVGIIIILLIISVKRKFIYALNYILFPVGMTLFILSFLGPLNLMHFFSLIILIAIGIDYGIYMANSQQEQQTSLAINYSLLSSFAAFGVLVFSSITALYSIGLAISLGLFFIFILTKVMK